MCECPCGFENKSLWKHVGPCNCGVFWIWLVARFDCYFISVYCLCHQRWVNVMFSPLSVCLPVNRISQKVMDRFGRNLVDTLGARDKDEMIRFWRRSRSGSENFFSDSSPLRGRAKNDIHKKVVDKL